MDDICDNAEEEAPESQEAEAKVEAPNAKTNTTEAEADADDDEVVEIDTDVVFGRKNTGKKQTEFKKKEEEKPVEAPVNSNDLEDEMLYDLM